MAKRVKRLGHGAAQAAVFIGLERELTIDTSKQTARIHDGVTEGGMPLAVESLATSPNATSNNPGRMSASQAGELAQALLDILANAAAISVNAAAISSNTTAISANTTAIGTKLPQLASSTPADAVQVAANGIDVESAGFQVVRMDAGTKAVFVQNAAPAGWTFDATQNDRVLRVTGTEANGGAVGGNWTISGVTVDGHILTVAELPPHSHGGIAADSGVDSEFSAGVNIFNGTGGTTGSAGSGNAHTHGVTADGAWRPQYQDVIVCTRD